MRESETIDDIVDTVVRGIDEGGWKTATDVVIATPKKEVRAWLDYIFKPYTFLKHADQDPLATLAESDFDPEGEIGRAQVRTPVTNAQLVCRILLENKQP